MIIIGHFPPIVSSVVQDLKKGVQVDPHWRPQYLQCPFCSHNFRCYCEALFIFLLFQVIISSVYSYIEENQEDTLYFFTKADLLSRLNLEGDEGMRNVNMKVSNDTPLK